MDKNEPSREPTELSHQDGKSLRPKATGGITLIPQPSDDPQDPLNWTFAKKAVTTAIWCLGGLVGTASGLGNALGYFGQAKVYGKPDPIDLSYSVVAATAGIAVGPLFAVPLGRKYGRSFVFFWSMVGLLVTGIWSALMTQADQYIPFVLARLFGGFFGGNPAALGADAVVALFFLHQRGKALTALNLSFLFGVVMGPTFSGFIVNSAPWPVQFWWTNGLEAFIIVFAFFFLHDTYFDRQAAVAKTSRQWPKRFFANRMSTFFCGARIIPEISMSETVGVFFDSILIGLSPVTVLCGGLTLVDFGFAAFFNIVLTVFLQDPINQGGYNFTPIQNAAFTFCLWFGVFAAQLYGFLVSDRFPLFLCRRSGGVWEPEYRLHALWVPGVVLPVALGLYGASLQYHLHFMVLALANFLGGFSTNAIIPIAVNYIIECFKNHASESAAIMGLYRLAFSLTLPFFVPAWIAAVGPGWCLGMAAFFSVFAYSSVIILMYKGRTIRQWSFKRVASSEGGLRLVDVETNLVP